MWCGRIAADLQHHDGKLQSRNQPRKRLVATYRDDRVMVEAVQPDSWLLSQAIAVPRLGSIKRNCDTLAIGEIRTRTRLASVAGVLGRPDLKSLVQ